MDYMRILLLIKDRTARNAGIMSAMELVMIALGHEDFRMKEYIYEASGTAVFIYVKMDRHTVRNWSIHIFKIPWSKGLNPHEPAF